MTVERIDTRFQLRRGTTAQWADADPVLAAGEPGVDLDTGALRIGDGDTVWSALPDSSGIPGPPGTTDYAALDNLPELGTAAATDAGDYATAATAQAVAAMVPRRGGLPGVLSVLTGTEDETLTVASGAATVTADTTNFRVGGQGWKVNKVGAGTVTLSFVPAAPIVAPVQAVGMWVFISDASLFATGYLMLRIYTDAEAHHPEPVAVGVL